MKRIWKNNLQIVDDQLVQLPKGAQILTAQMQRGVCSMWVLCDPSAPCKSRHITIYGTGNPMPENPGQFIATIQLVDDNLVFHIFDQGESSD